MSEAARSVSVPRAPTCWTVRDALWVLSRSEKKPAFWRVGYLQRIYLHRLCTVARNERMVDVSGESDLGIAKPEIRIFIWISVRN
jgi:hypothetical protein